MVRVSIAALIGWLILAALSRFAWHDQQRTSLFLWGAVFWIVNVYVWGKVAETEHSHRDKVS